MLLLVTVYLNSLEVKIISVSKYCFTSLHQLQLAIGKCTQALQVYNPAIIYFSMY